MKEYLDFYVGGYAEPGAPGLLKCRLNGREDTVTVLERCAELRNPSWVLPHPTLPVVYAVEEIGPEGRLTALSAEDGLRKAASLPTGGADPCHICLSPGGEFALVSNYTGGSLAVFRLDEAGLPTERTDLLRHDAAPAPGRIPSRQEGPHIHFSMFHGERVYVNDLGLDQIAVYGFDAARGRLLEREEVIPFPAGSGPRHAALSPDEQTLYALCELTARLRVYRRETGWRCVQELAPLPEDAGDFARYAWSMAAGIKLRDPHTLFISIRGSNCLVRYAILPDGTLTGGEMLPCGGRTPRDFLLWQDQLIVALQDSDRVDILRRDAPRDAYRPVCSLPALRPTCVAPLPAD